MTDPLVGRWFHSFDAADDGCEIVAWQGHVIGCPEPGTYLVQTLDWLMGDTSDAVLVSLADMRGWVFYQSDEDMRFAYDHGLGKAARSRHHLSDHRPR